jgi:hypothetical protein
MGRRHGPRHGLLARPMGGTARPAACPCRHGTKGRAGHGPPAWPMTRPWHGTAGTAAQCRHGHTSPPLLASPLPDRISFASARIFSASPPLLSFHGQRAPFPSTAARRARTRAPRPMGGTGGTAQVNGPCAVSWAEGLVDSTVWHGTVGTARHVVMLCWHGTAVPRVLPTRHGGHLYSRPLVGNRTIRGSGFFELRARAARGSSLLGKGSCHLVPTVAATVLCRGCAVSGAAAARIVGDVGRQT